MHTQNSENIVPKGHVTPHELHHNAQNHERNRKTCFISIPSFINPTNSLRVSQTDPANKFKHTINLINGAGIHREAYFKFSWRGVSSEQARRRIKNDSNLRRVCSVTHWKLHLIFNSYFLTFCLLINKFMLFMLWDFLGDNLAFIFETYSIWFLSNSSFYFFYDILSLLLILLSLYIFYSIE